MLSYPLGPGDFVLHLETFNKNEMLLIKKVILSTGCFPQIFVNLPEAILMK